jgi:hypothetical protein
MEIGDYRHVIYLKIHNCEVGCCIIYSFFKVANFRFFKSNLNKSNVNIQILKVNVFEQY